MNDDVVRLLELLADGAGGEQLAHVAVENPQLSRASALALRIHSTLTAHRRREAELSALFDTASDLAGLRDTDAVLRSIVRRARTLLGVDVSYLSLNDEVAGRTYMRVTDGSVSALFQKVTLGMGEGLGGLVAQAAQPYATRDYFGDERYRHTWPIDSAVRDEGLTAILGVPLALGDQVIGVLYASDRTPREFTPDEIALLSSLADHAAIALDNARLLEEISEQSAALRRAEEAHDRLMDLALRGADVPEVAAAVADVLHGGISVFDADGAELTSDPVAPVPPPAAIAASRASGRAMSTSDGWVCAVQAGPELLGSLVLSGRGDLVDADRRLFERAAVVTALLLMLRRSVAKAEDEVRGELLTDLLTAPERNPGALLARAERLGLDLAEPHAVLIAHAERVPRTRLAVAAGRCAALAGIHAEEVVFLVPATDAGSLAARIAETLRSAVDSPVTVGASGPAHGPREIAAAHAEAARCLRALLALGRVGEGASMDGLGFLGVLLGEQTDLPGFVRRTIGPVLDYDARRGTELLATLNAYFESGANLTRAKDVLHVHVNTVVQRLDRIGSLLGADWQTPDRALEIQLALRVRTLQG
ncbi:GAF domain-containing protein [Saccharopolyspora oryzae]|uniref:Helix-turn-helix domain-containing protein n=1 Tax=Saccharopolyspora oryzae TaxID=2997343 RepID=A0ABT4V3R2_9PSEU|nr:GAF domain-containing protein [Saccharopolyspora oryzae]MDA3628603.1 helix-turn-helix domain-containing protein [Saccharopolyspora oryzae]